MYWLWLFLAIVLEVAATVCLKLSSGFSKFVPTALMALFYGGSFFLAAIALRKLEIATAYAVWSAVGTAMMTVIGMLVFKEAVNPMKFSAIALIVAGVVCLSLAGRGQNSQPEAREQKRALAVQASANTGGQAEPKLVVLSARDLPANR